MLVLVGGFGLMALCQGGYGVVRPHLPSVVRSSVGGEKEFEAREYLRYISEALGDFNTESEQCAVNRDQACRTKAIERLLDRTDWLPATAGWMAEVHAELRESVAAVLEVNRRVERGDNSSEFLREGQQVFERLGDALVAWHSRARE